MVSKRNKHRSVDIDETKKITAMLVALTDEQALNNWEQDFVSDVSSKFENEKVLHPNTITKLEQIYRKFN